MKLSKILFLEPLFWHQISVENPEKSPHKLSVLPIYLLHVLVYSVTFNQIWPSYEFWENLISVILALTIWPKSARFSWCGQIRLIQPDLAMIGQNDKKREGKDKNATKADNALASRLEQAAEEQEKRDAETRLAAEKKREEERLAREEAQRQREEEFHKKEEARMEAARQKAEDIRRKEEEKIAAEKADIMARQKAQDDYWAKKLEKERAKHAKKFAKAKK